MIEAFYTCGKLFSRILSRRVYLEAIQGVEIGCDEELHGIFEQHLHAAQAINTHARTSAQRESAQGSTVKKSNVADR